MSPSVFRGVLLSLHFHFVDFAFVDDVNNTADDDFLTMFLTISLLY